jgi:hypothetical protein
MRFLLIALFLFCPVAILAQNSKACQAELHDLSISPIAFTDYDIFIF